MALSFIFGGGMSLAPFSPDLLPAYPAMRQCCQQVGEWTGLDPEELLTQDFTGAFELADPQDAASPPDGASRPRFMHLTEVRQTMYSIGVADVLAGLGLRPDAIAGSSLGSMAAACVAGSVARADLFGLLSYMSDFPLAPAGEPPRGLAFAVIAGDADTEWYWGEARPNVHLAGDGATIPGGKLMMVSGLLPDLVRLGLEAPDAHVKISSAVGGLHNPHQAFVSELMKPYLDKLEFRDPVVPLYSALDGQRRLRTGADVRADFLNNAIQPALISHIQSNLNRHGTELALLLGPSVHAGTLAEGPFPVAAVETAADVTAAMSALYDLGLDCRPPAG